MTIRHRHHNFRNLRLWFLGPLKKIVVLNSSRIWIFFLDWQPSWIFWPASWNCRRLPNTLAAKFSFDFIQSVKGECLVVPDWYPQYQSGYPRAFSWRSSIFSVSTFHPTVQDEEFLPYTDTSDLWVYKISLWCCSFSLAVSVGAALLLPISTISNEVGQVVWNASSSELIPWLSFIVFLQPGSPPLSQLLVHEVAQRQFDSGIIFQKLTDTKRTKNLRKEDSFSEKCTLYK